MIARKEFRMEEEKFYTIAEVATLFRVSKSYIYELVSQRKINFIRLSERRIRIPATALEKLEIQYMNCLGYNKSVQPPTRGRKPNVS